MRLGETELLEKDLHKGFDCLDRLVGRDRGR